MLFKLFWILFLKNLAESVDNTLENPFDDGKRFFQKI